MIFARAMLGLGLKLLSSLVLIAVGIIYFMVTIWMVKVGASWAGYNALEGSWVVLTAGIVTGAVIIGSAIKK
jgi:hypothetical protein